MTPEQYRVLREHGTERAGTSPLNNEKASGMYKCAGCGADLFPSDTKYDSGTGWPSYYAPTSPEAVSEHVDKSWFSMRAPKCGARSVTRISAMSFRRAEADRITLLHERNGARFHAGEGKRRQPPDDRDPAPGRRAAPGETIVHGAAAA